MPSVYPQGVAGTAPTISPSGLYGICDGRLQALAYHLLPGSDNPIVFFKSRVCSRDIRQSSSLLRNFARRSSVGLEVGIAFSLRDLGEVVYLEGEYGKARDYSEESIATANKIDMPHIANQSLWGIGKRTLAAELSPEVVTAAESRGMELDLWETARDLARTNHASRFTSSH